MNANQTTGFMARRLLRCKEPATPPFRSARRTGGLMAYQHESLLEYVLGVADAAERDRVEMALEESSGLRQELSSLQRLSAT